MRGQGSFHDLEEMLKSLRDYRDATTDERVSKESKKESLTNTEEVKRRDVKSQDIPVVKIRHCDELRFEDLLMEILLRQQLHTEKEYTFNGLKFMVYVLDDTELWTFYVVKELVFGRTEQLNWIEVLSWHGEGQSVAWDLIGYQRMFHLREDKFLIL